MEELETELSAMPGYKEPENVEAEKNFSRAVPIQKNSK